MLSQDQSRYLLLCYNLQLVSILSYRFALWPEGSIQMWPHCRLKIVYCFSEDVDLGRTLWTDADQLLQSAHLCWRDTTLSHCRGMTWGAGNPIKLPSPCGCSRRLVMVGLNREDASGQSTDHAMQPYVMLLCVLDSAVMWWHVTLSPTGRLSRGLSGGVQ